MSKPKARSSTTSKLIRAILTANHNIEWADAREFAEAIMAFTSPLDQRSTDELVLWFGEHKGKRLQDCPKGYIEWLAGITESKKHTPEFMKVIRAARTIVLSWQDMTQLPQDCPFDV